MKKRKIITIIVALICCLECGLMSHLTLKGSLYAIAEEKYESYDIGDYNFRLFNDHAELYKVNDTIRKAVIPSNVKGLPVTKIRGFLRCDSLISVEIPDTVITIQSMAFNSCSSLVSISIPNSVTEIEQSAFKNCRALESITLSNNLLRQHRIIAQ